MEWLQEWKNLCGIVITTSHQTTYTLYVSYSIHDLLPDPLEFHITNVKYEHERHFRGGVEHGAIKAILAPESLDHRVDTAH